MNDGGGRTLAVMQPTFLPWLGYFALIASADIFVFLDDVQFSKQSWQSRNRISSPNGEVLLSVPVVRKPTKAKIMDVKLADENFGTAMLARIEGSLGKGPFWPYVRELLLAGFANTRDGLAGMNIGLIQDICTKIGITTDFRRSSMMQLEVSDRSNRLLALSAGSNAKTYLSPIGAAKYLAEDRPFDGSSTELRFQNFTHPVYDQGRGAFLPFMSIIDALAWIGPERTRDAVLQGIGPNFMESQLDGFG